MDKGKSTQPSDFKGTQLTYSEQGCAVLIGDACHPTLPYQAQGAAMAVEDGVILGKLLGALNSSTADEEDCSRDLPQILRLFEKLRKARTTVTVQGATENQTWYHLPDGSWQEKRDASLATADYKSHTEWSWTDGKYQSQLLGWDSIGESQAAFSKWVSDKNQQSEVKI